MAIKITTDKVVRIIRPDSRKFNLDELNNHVGDFINPLKIGPVWVMSGEGGKMLGAEYNEIASFFFGSPFYGDVIVVPPQQLPADWDIMDPSDYKYTVEELDGGVLLSLQTALVHNRVFGSIDGPYTAKEEWTFTPPKNDEIDEGTRKFYRRVYDYITENPDMFKKNIILQDEEVVVKIDTPDDRKVVLQQMLDYFVYQEEYEKCALLKKTIEE
jgi:hypothetical protein